MQRDYVAEGWGPADVEHETDPRPEAIVVNVVKPGLCSDGEVHDRRTFKVYPLFMAKAARRWADYWRRKHGAGNVWAEEV